MDSFDRLIGSSTAAEQIRALGRRAARIDAPALLTGETGTGKGILARAIHDASARARGPFVQVNCAAVSDSLFESEFFGHVRGAFTGALQPHRGFFEQAHRGTLFLDEVGELPPPAQAKLLLAIETGEIRRVGAESAFPVDIRIISATCRNLASALDTHGFRRDLYHRLAVLRIHLPALRDRAVDIPDIARDSLRRARTRFPNASTDIPASALDLLESCPWPGNVRELIHALEADLAAHDHISADGLRAILATGATAIPESVSTVATRRPQRYSHFGSREDERVTIEAALRACNGNRTHAARLLGMSRNTLLGRIYRYELDVVPSRHGLSTDTAPFISAPEVRSTVEKRCHGTRGQDIND